ncbi:hypothetical protein ACW0JT_07605 [Arthrobacter sp. SA17]
MVSSTSAFPPGYRTPDADAPGVRARAEAVTAVVPVPDPDPEASHRALAVPVIANTMVRTRARTVAGAGNRRLGKAPFLLVVTVIGAPGN